MIVEAITKRIKARFQTYYEEEKYVLLFKRIQININ
jgi:hypothetical protein